MAEQSRTPPHRPVLGLEKEPELEVMPAAGMADGPFRVTAQNLTPGARVRLSSSLKDEKGGMFRCECYYVADRHGVVDTAVHPSVGGDFEGVQPFGLLDQMQPVEMGRRLLKRDVRKPWVINVELHGDGEAPLAARSAERHYLGPGVTVHEVTVGRLRGRVFVPPAQFGRVPAVIDLFGSIGGCIDFRAALLASHGFVTFALAFAAYKDCPKSLAHFAGFIKDKNAAPAPLGMDLAYFEEAAQFLQQHPRALEGAGVGFLGHSFGGGVGMAMAAYFAPSLVGAVVSINNGNALSVPLRIGDRKLLRSRHLVFDPCVAEVNDEGHGEGKECYDQPDVAEAKGKLFPIDRETSRVPVMLMAGGADAAWPSVAYMRHHARFLAQQDAAAAAAGEAPLDHTLKVYPGAGHLLEPPNAPLNRLSRRTSEKSGLFQTSINAKDPNLREWLTKPTAMIDWGGRMTEHAAAQREHWADLKDFFHTKLRASAERNLAGRAAQQQQQQQHAQPQHAQPQQQPTQQPTQQQPTPQPPPPQWQSVPPTGLPHERPAVQLNAASKLKLHAKL